MRPTPRKTSNDLPGTLGALIFIVIGGLCWWSIRDAPSVEAVIFPRTVIGLMAALSGLLIVRNLFGLSASEAPERPGSVSRRIGLLAAMIAGTLAMPYIGFVIAGLASYMAIMLVAMYEQWSLMRRVVYPVAGVVVIFAFYALFKGIFLVPLPEPAWFQLPF